MRRCEQRWRVFPGVQDAAREFAARRAQRAINSGCCSSPVKNQRPENTTDGVNDSCGAVMDDSQLVTWKRASFPCQLRRCAGATLQHQPSSRGHHSVGTRPIGPRARVVIGLQPAGLPAQSPAWTGRRSRAIPRPQSNPPNRAARQSANRAFGRPRRPIQAVDITSAGNCIFEPHVSALSTLSAVHHWSGMAGTRVWHALLCM